MKLTAHILIAIALILVIWSTVYGLLNKKNKDIDMNIAVVGIMLCLISCYLYYK